MYPSYLKKCPDNFLATKFRPCPIHPLSTVRVTTIRLATSTRATRPSLPRDVFIERKFQPYFCEGGQKCALSWYAQSGWLLVLSKCYCYSYSRLAIGFKRCFGFLKPEAFFPSNITTGSLIAQSFFYLY